MVQVQQHPQRLVDVAARVELQVAQTQCGHQREGRHDCQHPDRRGQAAPDNSRTRASLEIDQSGDQEILLRTVDVMDEIAQETGKTHSQIALNWLLARPTVASLIFGARNEAQFRENLGAIGWNLSTEQIARLDAASATTPTYPYWHQMNFKERNPFPTL